MPQGWDLGYCGGVGGHFSECVSYLQECTCNGTIFWVPAPLGPWGVAKRLIIIKSQLLSQFQRFLKSNFVCFFTYEIYKTYQIGFLFDRLGHAQGLDLEVLWGLGVIFF